MSRSICARRSKFLSTPSARRATSVYLSLMPSFSYFYPRPPRGGRQRGHPRAGSCRQFLSTPSARRATKSASYPTVNTAYFYPRPPRGGRQTCGKLPAASRSISIHALREEGDDFFDWLDAFGLIFLSTPSARRATMQCAWLPSGQRISIHALREEGDQAALDMGKATTNFYPRPPRGGRPAVVCESMLLSYFYPRPPRGGRQKL